MSSESPGTDVLHGDELRVVVCGRDDHAYPVAAPPTAPQQRRLRALVTQQSVWYIGDVEDRAAGRLVAAGLASTVRWQGPAVHGTVTLLPHALQHPAILEQLWALEGT